MIIKFIKIIFIIENINNKKSACNKRFSIVYFDIIFLSFPKEFHFLFPKHFSVD